MKKTRFVISLVLMLALLAAAPLSALAATWEAETSDDVANAFYTDTDAEVIVNLKNDINMDEGLSTNESQSYTINGNGNTIADVYVYGNGSAEINADVTSVDNGEALYVGDSAEVTVNGDVTGADGNSDDGYGAAGVDANDNAQVTINGDVSGGDGYGYEYEGDYGYNGGSGIEASDYAQVTVNGDVSGGDGYLDEEAMQDPTAYDDGGYGIYADDNAQVTVNGDVSGGDSMGTYAWGGDGIYVEDVAKVEVTGDVTGGDVTADPAVEAVEGNESIGGDGIVMETDNQVVVGGDVTAGSTNADSGIGGDGIRVYDYGDNSGSVEVGGTVTAGKGETDGYAIYLGETEYDTCLEDVLAATPEEILTDLLAVEEDGNLENTMYAALALTYTMMLNNGDLTDEEYAAFEEARDKLEAESESEEEFALGVFALMQETIKKEASSDNLLELSGRYIDVSVGDVEGESSSMFGARSTELYATDGRGAGSGSNPQTGESPVALILGAVMLVSLMGVGALVFTRKRAV